MIGLLKLIPPNGFLCLQVVGCNYYFYLGGVIMQLEIFLHLQHIDLNCFSLPMLTIEIWWLDIFEFTLQNVSLYTSPMPSNRTQAWVALWP
jgi:hypothetical protein